MATDEVAHPGAVFRMQYCYVHDGNGGNNVKSRAERNEIYFNWIEGAMYHELELIGPDPDGAPSDGRSSARTRTWSATCCARRRRRSSRASAATAPAGRRGATASSTTPSSRRTGSGAVFRLFDGLESVEMHNNVIVTNGTGGPNVMRANAAEFMWVNGVNIAGIEQLGDDGRDGRSDAVDGNGQRRVGRAHEPHGQSAAGGGSPIANAGNASLSGPAGFPFPNRSGRPAFTRRSAR